ncbi:hypothetical protein [Streptomyces aurantiogriseus]|uniref:Uncharacterized protein n=1 Tax=Streptomyces aurantiogriseus TaxID=66870 RepID=A0A918FI42_9ACTN|nr:hypothetical protein [Streptomyces aurantiogriseus]GGR38971.1 hypothetical protein GCM10010251_64480 [Streptomyces aurantiogriseus]
MFETITDFFGGLFDGPTWASAATSAVCASLGALLLARFLGWRRISWSEVYNGPINSKVGPGMWEVHWEGRAIRYGSLVMLEVRNSGVQTLEPEHFAAPLTFTFAGKKVVHYKVRDAKQP